MTWKGDTLVSIDAWSFLVAAYDGSAPSNAPVIYLNGIPDGATCITVFGSTCQPGGPMTPPRGSLYLGGTTGLYDEFRYSNTVRSASWIETEYRNQASPDSFYAVGAQESRGRRP